MFVLYFNVSWLWDRYQLFAVKALLGPTSRPERRRLWRAINKDDGSNDARTLAAVLILIFQVYLVIRWFQKILG